MKKEMHRLFWGLPLSWVFSVSLSLWAITFVESSTGVPGSWTAGSKITTVAWSPTFRGGAEAASPSTSAHSVVAVFQLGVVEENLSPSPRLSWLVGDDATPFSAVLLGAKITEQKDNHPLFRIPRLPQDTKMMTSLGLLSDVIVVVVPSSDTINNDQALSLLEEVSERLLEIAYAADVNRLPRKKRLVVVSDSADDSWWVQEVVQQRLRSITPTFWETFDVLTPQNLKLQWQTGSICFLSDEDGLSGSVIRTLIPYEDNSQVFARLVQQVYRFSGGTSTDGMGNAVDDSAFFFALQTVPTPSAAIFQAPKRHNTKERPLEDPQDRIQKVLQDAQGKLADLESKMQEVQLESQATKNAMPLLDFGSVASAILEEAYRELEQCPPNVRTGLMRRLVLEVDQLYKDQLQSLRDYYGRRYELSLEQEEKEAVWAAEAEHMTQGFQTAAQHAVPSLCQADGPLANIASFDSISALQGLVQDMLEATQLRKDEQSLAFDEDDLEDLAPKRRRLPPWAKKIASRAIALGINYLQGWLAWQGIKRAALERDREMPKFPLF